MKKKHVLIICLILAIIIGIVVGLLFYNNRQAVKIKKQIDLGNKYLLSCEYEQAIAEFNKVISIDPMNVEAYIGLADAYLGMGDYDSAVTILQNGINCLKESKDSAGEAILQDKLNQILSSQEPVLPESEAEETDDDSENNELPVIKLKPIVDAAAPYGVSAAEWSVEKLIEHDGLEYYDTGGSQFYTDSFYGEEFQITHEAKLYEDDGISPRPGIFSWRLTNSDNYSSDCMWLYVSDVNNEYYFVQSTEDTDGHVIYEYVAKLFKEEGVTDAYSLMSYIGLNKEQADYIIANSDVGQERIEIETDYGSGSIAVNLYENDDRLYDFYMEIYAGENREHGHLKEIEYKKDKEGVAKVFVKYYRK